MNPPFSFENWELTDRMAESVRWWACPVCERLQNLRDAEAKERTCVHCGQRFVVAKGRNDERV